MESNSPAEELPALYRAILDRVAVLEAAGERAQAAQLRTDAREAYSRAWDERARRRLETLLRRSERAPGAERSRRRSSRTPATQPKVATTDR
jgi:hypothetical protein